MKERAVEKTSVGERNKSAKRNVEEEPANKGESREKLRKKLKGESPWLDRF